MTDKHAPILDFDPAIAAIIEPQELHPAIEGLPHRCVITWMGDAFSQFENSHDVTERHRFTLETVVNPIYEFDVEGEKILVTMANVGAPAAAALFEALIAIGCTDFVAIGSSGGLVPELPPGTVVVPDAAIRDEGVSYHYAPASLMAYPDPGMQTTVHDAYQAAGNRVARGIAWTTDAFYRETSAKVAQRVAQGAIAVDMELASLAAIASFRNVRLGHALYLADTLHSEQWDPTELVDRDTAFRYQLLLTATRACATL
ncbi:MAG: nucleoside phosphorylase [Acidimicrobiales bacterium]